MMKISFALLVLAFTSLSHASEDPTFKCGSATFKFNYPMGLGQTYKGSATITIKGRDPIALSCYGYRDQNYQQNTHWCWVGNSFPDNEAQDSIDLYVEGHAIIGNEPGFTFTNKLRGILGGNEASAKISCE